MVNFNDVFAIRGALPFDGALNLQKHASFKIGQILTVVNKYIMVLNYYLQYNNT